MSTQEPQTKPDGGASVSTAELGCMPRVLDPCCGSRMMWFDRQHPDVVFGDKRTEQHVLCDGRTLRIEPDMTLDFTDLPFDDGTFRLIAFDPPHLHSAGPKSWMAAKYGKLTGDWREDLRKGFAECFRVLASDGVLIFKWNETQVKVREVLALTSVQPLFGHPTGRNGLTHWMVFMKPNAKSEPTAPLLAQVPHDRRVLRHSSATDKENDMEGFEVVDMGTTEGRAKVAAYEAEKAEKVKSGQQLFAKIKRTSKYYGQGEKGALFPVFVESGYPEGYMVQGGPGGQYRLSDVNLYVVEDGREMRIS